MNLTKGHWALITGASSGIGEAFAEALAARGLNLILVARSGDTLKDLAVRLARDAGIRAEVLPFDLSLPGAAAQVAQAVKALGLTVHLLVNNAGFGKWGEFLDFDQATYAGMVQLNVTALTELTHEFLPALLTNGGEGVINVGSTASLVPVPYAGVYAATKAYVLSFTEALYGEYGGRGPHFMTLCPGGTATRFAEVANAEVARRRGNFGAPPARIVADGLKAFEAGKTYVVTTSDNHFGVAVLPRLLPRRTVIGIVGGLFRKVAGK